MSVTVYKDNFSDFINTISLKRGELGKWTALIIQSSDMNNPKKLDEIVQVLEFQFQKQEILILSHSEQKRVFVITRTGDRAALSLIEKSIANAFPAEDVKILMGVPLNRGLEILCKMLGHCLSPDDHPANICLKRLSRPSNAFLVLTDNKDIRAQALRTLQGFGHVAVAQDAQDFFLMYRDYAPNAVFIDSDLDKDKKESVITALRRLYDPYCFVVVIALVATDSLVTKYKENGVNGFIIPPFSYDTVLKQLARVPTKVSRFSSVR